MWHNLKKYISNCLQFIKMIDLVLLKVSRYENWIHGQSFLLYVYSEI